MDESDGAMAAAASGVSDEEPSKAGDARGKRASEEKAPVKWVKWVLAVAAAIVTLGGAVAVISQTTHWLRSVSSGTQAPQLTISPNLSISFHQYGQLDPMSVDDNGTVSVTLKSKPFELWFPTLAHQEVLLVCAATGDWVFANAAETAKTTITTCLTPGTGAAEGAVPTGDLFFTTPDYPKSTAIAVGRDLLSVPGYQKYDVSSFVPGGEKYAPSSFTGKHERIYLVIYRYNNDPQSLEKQFNPQRTENFTLNIG